jgi:hypothetical protein
MSDTLTTITKIINSPPGVLVAGGVLAGIVWKFFERVEAVLTDQTKLEIARWLRVKNLETGIVADETVGWPETFAKVFDRVFGSSPLSWRCFYRSAIASIAYGVKAPRSFSRAPVFGRVMLQTILQPSFPS